MSTFAVRPDNLTTAWNVVNRETGAVKCSCNGRNARHDALQIQALLDRAQANDLQLALYEQELQS